MKHGCLLLLLLWKRGAVVSNLSNIVSSSWLVNDQWSRILFWIQRPPKVLFKDLVFQEMFRLSCQDKGSLLASIPWFLRVTVLKRNGSCPHRGSWVERDPEPNWWRHETSIDKSVRVLTVNSSRGTNFLVRATNIFRLFCCSVRPE